MRLYAFTRSGIVRIVAASVMLSVYITTVIVNYASREITIGNLVATIFFIAALTAFLCFSAIKKHPPLLLGARVWISASLLMCFAALIFSASDISMSEGMDAALGYGVMLFASPFYGFVYLFDGYEPVGLIGMLVCLLLLFVPNSALRIAIKIKGMNELK